MKKYQRGEAEGLVMLLACVVSAVVILALLWAWPKYRVYSQEMRGKAALVEAESNRRIAVLEAEATKDAAVSLAAAEVERAKGVAEANKIIGDSLKGNEGYLRYLYIDALKTTPNQTIYIPTEAGLPILEATRKPANGG
jgi:regulator of protease activity HflC (stomatin/prohibitin superfamily)